MTGWLDERVIFDLNPTQQEEIVRDTGIHLARIEDSRAGFIGMLLASEAPPAFAPGGLVCSCTIELDEEQRQSLQQSLETEARRLRISIDGDVPCNEQWADTNELRVTDRISVLPHEAPEAARVDEQLVIRLIFDGEAGGVFGTGRHATTQLTAELLERWVSPGARAADIGTGSGILAIAALRLGACHVTGFDVLLASIDRARENVALNGLTDRVSLACREVDVDTDGPFDLVIANLLPTVLVPLAPAFARLVRPSGVLLVGGVVERLDESVASAVEAHGFETVERRSRGNWVSRAMRRLSPDDHR